MKPTHTLLITALIGTILLGSCRNAASHPNSDNGQKQVIEVPAFDADSAYAYISKQVSFGYRIPGTEAHKSTAQWLANELERHGATVLTQQTTLTAYNSTRLPICNIIGTFAPEKEKRVLLLAHWDSRPYADYDPDPANHHSPIEGANDGASGVGVLLEIARQIGAKLPDIGIDILLVDAEDYGAPSWHTDDSESWALGSQYWATHPHKPGYRAQYGILLDMVGAREGVFYREQLSQYYAKHIVDKVWQCAERLGYSQLFINEIGGAITDDHVYTNQAGIPTIDIIQLDPTSPTGFVSQWHTLDDNLSHIDRSILKAVGQTVLTVIYEE